MTTLQRPLVLALLALLVGPVSAEPVPGLWERRFTAFLADPVTGEQKPWAEPALQRCMSEVDLRKLPFLSAAASKASYESNGSRCTVSDETRSGAVASWNLQCREKDGRKAQMRVSVEASAEQMVSRSRLAMEDKAPGASDVEAEVRMQRLGACDAGKP